LRSNSGPIGISSVIGIRSMGTARADGDREYEAYLEGLYAEAADNNARVNIAKSAFLYRANTSIVCFVFLTVATFVPFAAHRALAPPAAQKIEIVNQSKAGQEMTMPNQNPTQKPVQPPPKPQAPPLRDLKEGEIPNPA